MNKKIHIDWERIEKMAMAGSNGQQISAAIGIHYDTLVNRCRTDLPDDISEFSEYLRSKREKGNDLLLRKQYDIAMGGDKTMLIWLGKQRLGQSEKMQQDVTSGGKAINTEPI
jgi:hypothetical protein